MSRFLALSIVLLILTMAIFTFALAAFGLEARGAPPPLPWRVQLGAWGLEALGLAALFLLIHRDDNPLWLSGVLSGWIAWVFRGPLLVVGIAAAGVEPRPFWGMTFRWWILYTLCGLVLAQAAKPPRETTPAPPGEAANPAHEAIAPAAPAPPAVLVADAPEAPIATGSAEASAGTPE